MLDNLHILRKSKAPLADSYCDFARSKAIGKSPLGDSVDRSEPAPQPPTEWSSNRSFQGTEKSTRSFHETDTTHTLEDLADLSLPLPADEFTDVPASEMEIGCSPTTEAVAKSSLEDIIDGHLTALRRSLLHALQNFHVVPRQSAASSNDFKWSRMSMRNVSVTSEVASHGLTDDPFSRGISGYSLQSHAKKIKNYRKILSFGESIKESESDAQSNGAERISERASLCRGRSLTWLEASLWPVWDIEVGSSHNLDFRNSATRNRSLGKVTRRYSQESEILRTGDIVSSNGYCQSVIVRPSSVKRVIWDMLSVLCIGYDILLVPMIVFDLSKVGWLLVIALLFAIFWTIDIIFTFLVGFHTQGVIEMRPKKIAKRYLKTWFLLDFLVLACDWFVLFQDSLEARGGDSVGLVRISKSFRVARVFRAVRFLRIWKVAHLVSEWNEYVRSENLMQVFGIINFVLVILVINHYVACGWYALAEYHPDTSVTHTWLSDLRRGSDRHTTMIYEYTTSLHWSFTQFTPASMEVHPRNTLERAYTIVVLLSGFLVFSSFVSGITSAMTRVRENNRERNRQEENIRTYITDNKVSLELGRRIYNYLRSRSLMNRVRVVEGDISAFKGLPPRLLADLHAEVFLPILKNHPFFLQFLHIDEMGLVEICHLAVGEVAAVKGQHIFSVEQKALKMTFCTDGFLTYFVGAGGDGSSAPFKEITANDYIAEAALWVTWLHKGSLEAASNCVLIELRAADFHNVASQTYAFRSCAAYARAFAERLMDSSGKDFRSCSASDDIGTFSYKKSGISSDVWEDEDVLRELARCAFEAQFEELHARENMLSKMATTIGVAKWGGTIKDFFRKRSTSSTMATGSGMGSVKQTLS